MGDLSPGSGSVPLVPALVAEGLDAPGATRRAYPGGREPDFWSPNPRELEYRYALGRLGANATASDPLVVMGMNPSHANEISSDATVNNVISASAQLGYTEWIMLNLYPERASSPADLHGFDPVLSDSNCAFIRQFVQGHGISEIWGAWGDLPNSTIRQAKRQVLQTLSGLGTRIFFFGEPTAKGEPRHLNPRGPKLDVTAQKHYSS